jgi:hypothetical protein
MRGKMLNLTLLLSLLAVGGCGFTGMAKTAASLPSQCPKIRPIDLTVIEQGDTITASERLYVFTEEGFIRWQLYVIGLEEHGGCNE